MYAADQRNDAGDVRRRHRRAAEQTVLSAGLRAENVHTGRGQLHAAGAEVGKGGELIVVVRGGDGDDVVGVEAGRVKRLDVVVARAVAGAGDKDVAVIGGVADRLLKERIG